MDAGEDPDVLLCAAAAAVKAMPTDELRAELKARRNLSTTQREEARTEVVKRRAAWQATRIQALLPQRRGAPFVSRAPRQR